MFTGLELRDKKDIGSYKISLKVVESKKKVFLKGRLCDDYVKIR